MIPCVLAIQIEKAANRALFYHFPEKFSDIPHASGIEDWELEENKRKMIAASTLTSELLPVTLHDDEETTFSNMDQAPQVVPPRYGISISDKNIYTCALTS